MSKDKSKRNRDKDISFGHKHYWTDTQGCAHRVVFDGKTLEKPAATWIVLITVTALALVVGVALIITSRPTTAVHNFAATPKLGSAFTLARAIADGVASHASAIAAGWNDEFFLADDNGVTLYDASGKKLETWSFDETTAPTALAFVADEESRANGLLLVGYPEKVKYLQFSLEQVAPVDSANDVPLPGNADAETEANNAVVRTAARGAQGAPKTLLTRSDADIRGLDSSGDRLFVGDYKAGRVWSYSLDELYARAHDAEAPAPAVEIGAPDEYGNYPGLRPTFPRSFSLSYQRERNALFVANPGLFRVDAFDPVTGAWSSELSWSRAPGAVESFRGAANPISVVATADRFLIGESGVFLHGESQARLSSLRLFTDAGEWLADIADAEGVVSSRDSGATVVSVAASRTLQRFFALYTDGSVEVWEAR